MERTLAYVETGKRTHTRKGVKMVVSSFLWVLVGLFMLLLIAPVAASPIITAVPLWLALVLALLDVTIFVLAVRMVHQPAARGLVLIGGFAFVAAVAIVLSQVLAHTPPILGADGEPLPGSIAVMEQVELNGSQQWVTIRGDDVNNPVLLFLSGGPGGSELPSTRLHLGELEKHYVVVNWDQPGAAKSYTAVARSELTPARYIDDGITLARYLCERFGEEKIYLMGESWGTILGAWLVRDYPESFHAFVSSGQMVNTTENDILGYEFALEYLAERGAAERIEALRRNGPPPYTEGNLTMTYASYLGVLNGYMAQHAHGEGASADILIDAINEPEYGLLDKVNWLLGLMNTFNTVYPQIADLDLTTQAKELDVPAYFLVGRYDVNAMASLVERYYAVLDAPHKELIWFEKSGHPPLYSEASKVVDIMVNHVLAGQSENQ